jgi:hypothetical protein
VVLAGFYNGNLSNWSFSCLILHESKDQPYIQDGAFCASCFLSGGE